jgi:hypothetical protein
MFLNSLIKLTESQKVYILKTIEQIVTENPENIEEKVADLLIKLALSELIQPKVLN